jgi:hypothetical protein
MPHIVPPHHRVVFAAKSGGILRAQAQGCLLGGQILADSEGGDILIEERGEGGSLIASVGKIKAGISDAGVLPGCRKKKTTPE